MGFGVDPRDAFLFVWNYAKKIARFVTASLLRNTIQETWHRVAGVPKEMAPMLHCVRLLDPYRNFAATIGSIVMLAPKSKLGNIQGRLCDHARGAFR